jgi:hypothetical protein
MSSVLARGSGSGDGWSRPRETGSYGTMCGPEAGSASSSRAIRWGRSLPFQSDRAARVRVGIMMPVVRYRDRDVVSTNFTMPVLAGSRGQNGWVTIHCVWSGNSDIQWRTCLNAWASPPNCCLSLRRPHDDRPGSRAPQISSPTRLDAFFALNGHLSSL